VPPALCPGPDLANRFQLRDAITDLRDLAAVRPDLPLATEMAALLAARLRELEALP
jgi:hypothetical protein